MICCSDGHLNVQPHAPLEPSRPPQSKYLWSVPFAADVGGHAMEGPPPIIRECRILMGDDVDAFLLDSILISGGLILVHHDEVSDRC